MHELTEIHRDEAVRPELQLYWQQYHHELELPFEHTVSFAYTFEQKKPPTSSVDD